MDIGSKIKNRRQHLGLTLEQVGTAVGVGRSTVKKWEDGFISNMGRDKIAALATVLNIDPLELIYEDTEFGTDDKQTDSIIPITGMIPVFGSIPAGVPAFAEQYIEDYLPTTLKNPEDYFSLRVKGESMIGAGIPNGAKVVLKKQSTAENGQIVACRVNGDEATLKRFRQDGSTILLMPENSDFSPIILNVDQFEIGYAEILGVVKQIVIDVS